MINSCLCLFLFCLLFLFNYAIKLTLAAVENLSSGYYSIDEEFQKMMCHDFMLFALYFNRGRLHLLKRLISSLRCPLWVQVRVLCITVKHFNIRFSKTFLCGPRLVYSDVKTIKSPSQAVAAIH